LTVTSPFGEYRNGALHRGVDLEAAEGTEVVAPAAGKVRDVWTEDKGGLCLSFALRTPDGGYADDTTVADDSGLVLTFVHLHDTVAKPGDVVEQGGTLAHSGNTGSGSHGAHLHVMAEYVNDAPAWSLDTSNGRVMLDPVALFDGVQAAEAIPAVVVDKVDRSVVRDTGSVVITNNGAMVWGNGQAVGGTLKPVVDIGGLMLPSPSGDGGDDAPARASTFGGFPLPPLPPGLPPEVVAVARDLAAQGAVVLSKGGRLTATCMEPGNVARVVNIVGTGVQLAGAAAGALGGLATVLGPIAGALAGPASAIPYVGPVIGGVLGVVGAAAPIVGPIASAAGALAGPAGAVVQGSASGGGSPLDVVQGVIGRVQGAVTGVGGPPFLRPIT